ncbi:DUF3343 domain-containing protein [uncultured Phascolarctobacterium sp.]|uniref:DUF3343 domain-containing protein n=1 Tax=uncultured Phascolarctobacterium sp. TaxID=512296 RepID=UPI0025E80CD7|nr:DUF3343 domain-containing protein [uncultured Phascolarctobacterium sp.]
MRQYIATFFSHFGAVRFQHLCVERGWQAQLRPVPRSLSSSCGTCVVFQAAALEDAESLQTPELEQLVLQCGDGYEVVYTAAE